MSHDGVTSLMPAFSFWLRLHEQRAEVGHGQILKQRSWERNKGEVCLSLATPTHRLIPVVGKLGAERDFEKSPTRIGSRATRLNLKMIFKKSAGRVQNSPHVRYFRLYSAR
jgi:hypothetical protein